MPPGLLVKLIKNFELVIDKIGRTWNLGFSIVSEDKILKHLGKIRINRQNSPIFDEFLKILKFCPAYRSTFWFFWGHIPTQGLTWSIPFPPQTHCKKRLTSMLLSTFSGKRRMFGNHVGDWEHVTVRLYNNLPSRMYVGAHNFGGEYTWNGYTFVKGSERIKISHDGHPVIYAAEGSHGNWVANKRYVYKKLKNKDTLVDYTDTGIEWRTWENLKVIPFKKHGGYTGEDTWLNFKGRWGNREMGCGIFNIFKKVANECGLNNGPTAPNWKGVMQKLKLDKRK